MKSSRDTILEFHGQLEQFTKEMKKREQEEIDRLKEERKKVIDEYGIGDLGRGSGEDE